MHDPKQQDAASLALHDICLTASSGPFSLEVKPYEHLTILSDDAAIMDRLTDIIMGQIAVPAGQILISGVRCTLFPPDQRAVGALDRRDGLFDHLSIYDNIAFPLRARREKPAAIRERIGRIGALLGFDPHTHLRPDASDDETQFRARFGRLLAYAPDVMILNRPFEGLSDEARARCAKSVMMLQRALNLTILHLTRLRDEAFYGSGRIAVLRGGSLQQCADAPTLMDRPASPHVARIFSHANLMTGYVVRNIDDIAEIRLPCGTMVSAQSSDAVEEDHLCTLCVGPEKIALSLTGAQLDEEDQAPLEAVIQDIRHNGDHIHLRCKLSDGTEVDIRRMPMQYSASIQPGQKVYLAWIAGNARAFPYDEPGEG